MLSDTVGEQVTYWRKFCGWNRERLAEECGRIGMPELTAAVLTNIESGRRNSEGQRRRTISVDEAAVLARALSIPLISLLIPYPGRISSEMFPNETRETYELVEWANGENRLDYRSDFENNDNWIDPWSSVTTSLWYLRAHQELVKQRRIASANLQTVRRQMQSAREEDPEALDPALLERRDRWYRKIEEFDLSIMRHRQHMRHSNWPTPPLPLELKHLDDMTVNEYRETRPRPDSLAADLAIVRDIEEFSLRRNDVDLEMLESMKTNARLLKAEEELYAELESLRSQRENIDHEDEEAVQENIQRVKEAEEKWRQAVAELKDKRSY